MPRRKERRSIEGLSSKTRLRGRSSHLKRFPHMLMRQGEGKTGARKDVFSGWSVSDAPRIVEFEMTRRGPPSHPLPRT